MAGRPPGRVCIVEPDIILTVDEIREQNCKFTDLVNDDDKFLQWLARHRLIKTVSCVKIVKKTST